MGLNRFKEVDQRGIVLASEIRPAGFLLRPDRAKCPTLSTHIVRVMAKKVTKKTRPISRETKIYNGSDLIKVEAEFLERIEAMLGKEIPFIPRDDNNQTFGFYAEDRHVMRLSLNDSGIDTLPETIGNLVELKELYMNHDEVVSVPESMASLKHMEILVLDHNKLTELPAWIGDFSNLLSLTASFNQIAEIPDSFTKLPVARVKAFVIIQKPPPKMSMKIRTWLTDLRRMGGIVNVYGWQPASSGGLA